MKHGSLFSGIGGFDLAAEWMGWENVFHCEWNPFGQRVLKHYWPNAELFTDITKSDFTKYANTIDVLTGGFPCQPYSSAGKRLGKEDERHLWPEMLRAIREISPRFVVGENVRGLTNWNGGLVFNEVCTDLETLGYSVAPFVIPASAINAPHQRERVWFVAQANGDGCNQRNGEHEKLSSETGFNAFDDSREVYDDEPNVKHAKGQRQKWGNNAANLPFINANHFGEPNALFNERQSWHNFPTQSPICCGNDGLPTELDGITFPKWRNESIKAYGNAIVPQVVYEIFKAIENYENL
jgi:DNA (cytosine-5)-methyltransferase 1